MNIIFLIKSPFLTFKIFDNDRYIKNYIFNFRQTTKDVRLDNMIMKYKLELK